MNLVSICKNRSNLVLVLYRLCFFQSRFVDFPLILLCLEFHGVLQIFLESLSGSITHSIAFYSRDLATVFSLFNLVNGNHFNSSYVFSLFLYYKCLPLSNLIFIPIGFDFFCTHWVSSICLIKTHFTLNYIILAFDWILWLQSSG